MHTKTMAGLAGVSTNMKLLNTPFRVYKDAERRGDTAVMERAMGYVGDFAEKAEDYQKKAEKRNEGGGKGSKGKSENGAGKRHQEAQGRARGAGKEDSGKPK